MAEVKGKVDHTTYLRTLASHAFTLSPPGMPAAASPPAIRNQMCQWPTTSTTHKTEGPPPA